MPPVKKLFWMLAWVGRSVLGCAGDDMDAAKIRQLAKQIDDSLIEGKIYHILYSVRETNTDAFYNHKNELIKLLQDAMAKEAADPATDLKSPDYAARVQSRQDMIKSMK